MAPGSASRCAYYQILYGLGIDLSRSACLALLERGVGLAQCGEHIAARKDKARCSAGFEIAHRLAGHPHHRACVLEQVDGCSALARIARIRRAQARELGPGLRKVERERRLTRSSMSGFMGHCFDTAGFKQVLCEIRPRTVLRCAAEMRKKYFGSSSVTRQHCVRTLA